MTVLEMSNSLGQVNALNMMGQVELASKLEAAYAFIKGVAEQEGIMPFNERPLLTRVALSVAADVIEEAHNLLCERRDEEVQV